MTASCDALTEAFSTAGVELDELLDRVLAWRDAPELWLDFDQWTSRERPWVVKDGAHADVVVGRFAKHERALSFAQAMVARVEGATIDHDTFAMVRRTSPPRAAMVSA